MSFNYCDNNTAYISCLIEFTIRNSKSNFRKIFTSSLSCKDFQFSISEDIVDIDELPCQLVCNVGDLLPEPTEGSVGVCTGSLCDFGGSIGIKITVSNVNEFPGNPTESEFDSHAPPMVPANIFIVGKTVQSHRASSVTSSLEPRGWRSFDIRTGSYDWESRARKSFTIRCFLKDHPRWQRFNIPDINDLVQIQERLIGRLKHKDTRFQYLCCRIEDFSVFGSQPKSERPSMSGTAHDNISQTKKGLAAGTT
ncbi:unnamed protein product [Tuber aestivum]|uniref:Uncharacterized protein n=1 Tax=Tuber aestivum TaxID=59557 RepID=A0A292PJH8_9PEZI|nr:unnamed protein product [Tuber aestivum]